MKKSSPFQSKWLVFMNIPLQMGIIILLGVLAGRFLDAKTGLEPLFIVVLSLLSIGIALYNVFNQVKKIQEKKDD